MFSKRPHPLALAGEVGLFTGERLAATIAIARHLAAEGCTVCFTGSGVEADERVGMLARQFRGQVRRAPGDTSTPVGALGVARNVEQTVGPVLLWVHTLGAEGKAAPHDLIAQKSRTPSALQAAVACTQAAFTHLAARPDGRLVHVCPGHEVGSREVGQLALARLRASADILAMAERVAVCAIAVEGSDLLERPEPDMDARGVLASYVARTCDEDRRSELNRIEQRIGILFDDVLSAAQSGMKGRTVVSGATGSSTAVPTMAA